MARKVGIRKEDKNRWERRTPLIPEDLARLVRDQGLAFLVEPAPQRVFPDEAYQAAGAQMGNDLEECDVVLGVKEIPKTGFRRKGTYVFFSHTIKGQPYNMEMLRRLVELECNLIDYERITDEQNRRLIFFGRFAGLAGMIDTLWSLGERLAWEGLNPNPFLQVSRTWDYESLDRAYEGIRGKAADKLSREGLPAELCPFVVGFAGYGNVSKGAQEILDLFPLEEIAPESLPSFFEKGAYDRRRIYKVVFREEHMVRPLESGRPFDLQEYYRHPERYAGDFERHMPYLTVLMNCIYWDTPYPRLVTCRGLKEGFRRGAWRLKAVGDISCDIDGAVEFTKKATEPDRPVYVYEPEKDRLVEGVRGEGPVIMAVDNLPCELPLESSVEFSKRLSPFVAALAEADFSLPYDLLTLPEAVKKALILKQGTFTPPYRYMEKFIP